MWSEVVEVVGRKNPPYELSGISGVFPLVDRDLHMKKRNNRR